MHAVLQHFMGHTRSMTIERRIDFILSTNFNIRTKYSPSFFSDTIFTQPSKIVKSILDCFLNKKLVNFLQVEGHDLCQKFRIETTFIQFNWSTMVLCNMSKIEKDEYSLYEFIFSRHHLLVLLLRPCDHIASIFGNFRSRIILYLYL